MTKQTRREVLWMAHGRGGWMPWLWGMTKPGCERNIELAGCLKVSARPVVLTEYKPRKKVKR